MSYKYNKTLRSSNKNLRSSKKSVFTKHVGMIDLSKAYGPIHNYNKNNIQPKIEKLKKK